MPGLPLALGIAALAAAAAALAGLVPVAFSIATVFLFAGPHNWLEARYVLGRLPARVGKLRGFFVASAAGVVGLTAGYAALPWVAELLPDPAWIGPLYAAWNSVFVVWVAGLVWMRSRTNPRFDGGWVWPTALLILSGVWLSPLTLNVALVYVHPLVALVLLDRELRRSRPRWRRAYHVALLAVPLLMAVLWWRLHDAPNLAGTDQLTLAITNHAGAGYIDGASTHFLVAAHTFLEVVHYGAWVVLIPLVGLRSWPWELGTIPAARRGGRWARGVAAVLAGGLLVCGALWACFLLDYGTTRGVYFTAAMLHVLAEVPFLLRMV
ncbi:MAG: hypothetical protein K2P78_01850 [Gemmataceae bacterium]|nr:hypothetical protein [Gemmataceae bacterium]